MKGGDLVVCKQCNEAFHPECHRPKIEAQDRDHWFCRFCVLSKSVTRFVPSLLAKKVRKTYPYDIKALQWIEGGKQNKDERYCYCGGPGDWNLKMIKVIFFSDFYGKKFQCDFCSQWFHEACIASIKHPLLNGDLFYHFSCSVCSNGDEVLKRLNISWPEALHLIIYNLGLISPARFFRWVSFFEFFKPFFPGWKPILSNMRKIFGLSCKFRLIWRPRRPIGTRKGRKLSRFYNRIKNDFTNSRKMARGWSCGGSLTLIR